MLYLTPVLPLGLVSYMCGTTSMDLYSFAVAKIFSLPLYLMYTFMGASAHSFIKAKKGAGNDKDIGKSLANEANKLEENQTLVVSGLVLSVIMITLITRKIRKELMKVRYGITALVQSSRTRIATNQITDTVLHSIVNQTQCASVTHAYSTSLCKHVKILDEQKKEKIDGSTTPLVDNEEADEKKTELGLNPRRKLNTKNT